MIHVIYLLSHSQEPNTKIGGFFFDDEAGTIKIKDYKEPGMTERFLKDGKIYGAMGKPYTLQDGAKFMKALPQAFRGSMINCSDMTAVEKIEL